MDLMQWAVIISVFGVWDMARINGAANSRHLGPCNHLQWPINRIWITAELPIITFSIARAHEYEMCTQTNKMCEWWWHRNFCYQIQFKDTCAVYEINLLSLPWFLGRISMKDCGADKLRAFRRRYIYFAIQMISFMFFLFFFFLNMKSCRQIIQDFQLYCFGFKRKW